jgi:tetratricopeptide (TPR) repeat protein
MYEAAYHSRFLLFDLGVTYRSWFEDYEKAISAYKKVDELNRQWEDDWRYERYYEEYTYSLLMADRPEEVEHIADIGLKFNHKNDILVRRKGAAAIMMNDSAAVQRYKEDFRSHAKEFGEKEALTEHKTGHMYLWGKDTLGAVEYFRRAFEMDRERLNSLTFMVYCQLKCNMNFEECLKHSEYLLEQDPEYFGFLWVKGYSLHKLGRDLEALAFLREAEELFPYRELQRDIKEVERSLAPKEQ